MREHTITMYNNKVWGIKVSEYGLKKGYVDYETLSKMIGDCILNNTIREATMTDWEFACGDFDSMVFQDYIISERGYEILRDYTDELVFYNEKLDVYVWAVTHFGTAWDYVLTDIKLVDGDKL